MAPEAYRARRHRTGQLLHLMSWPTSRSGHSTRRGTRRL